MLESNGSMNANNNKFINPDLPGGFRDYLPGEEIARQKMTDTIRATFELFGFLPLDTPAIEREEILTGGDENFNKQIFKAGVKGGSEELALRFDLTVPLARVVSLYQEEIEKPFKRYQLGKVWRGERQQAGRFREFAQFDADIIGSGRTSADSEIVALLYKTFKNLGIERFQIQINNRKILNGLSDFAGYDAGLNADILRIIDKQDKIGLDGVSKELSEKLNNDQIEKIEEFLDIKSENSDEILDALAKLFIGSAEATAGISELRQIANDLRAQNIPDEYWKINLSVARGLGYYTGPIFETILLDLPNIGSVASGGRYDGLVSRFSAQNIPATGISIGVDRLFVALEKLGFVKKQKSLVKVLVLNFDIDAESYCQKIVSTLRDSGINSEIYLGKEEGIKSQLGYALKQEIPFVVIAGTDEKSKNEVQLKDLNARTQENISFDEVSGKIIAYLTEK